MKLTCYFFKTIDYLAFYQKTSSFSKLGGGKLRSYSLEILTTILTS